MAGQEKQIEDKCLRCARKCAIQQIIRSATHDKYTIGLLRCGRALLKESCLDKTSPESVPGGGLSSWARQCHFHSCAIAVNPQPQVLCSSPLYVNVNTKDGHV